jgi:hypothetical protein
MLMLESGILCARQNRGLGFFEDNPADLIDAFKYLQQHTISQVERGVDAPTLSRL